MLYSSENRRSNQLIPSQEKKNNLGSSKQFHDLRMYLKAPRKKEYYSEVKKKKEERHRNHSVYYEPKK